MNSVFIWNLFIRVSILAFLFLFVPKGYTHDSPSTFQCVETILRWVNPPPNMSLYRFMQENKTLRVFDEDLKKHIEIRYPDHFKVNSHYADDGDYELTVEVFGRIYASASYEIEDGIINIGGIIVNEAVRRQGISKLIFGAIHVNHPHVTTSLVDGIADVNSFKYLEGLAVNNSVIEGIKNTPAYKASKRLGFGRIEILPGQEDFLIPEFLLHRSDL